MSLRVNTNALSLNFQRHLSNVERRDTQNLEKMATGDNIAHSYHDPAGFAITNRMQAFIRSRQQAERNANDSISKFQVAEGALSTMQDIAVRMRELAMQAANDPLSREAHYNQLEFLQLRNEVTRIAKTTNYNSMKLLDRESGQYHYQVGIHSRTDNNRITLDTEKIYTTTENLGIEGINISSARGAQAALEPLTQMLDHLSKRRTEMGALQTRMVNVVDNNRIQNENEMVSRSRIRDTDMAVATAENAKLDLVKRGTIKGLFHANTYQANQVMKLIG